MEVAAHKDLIKVTKIEGNLTIRGDQITNLIGLRGFRPIGVDLNIGDNTGGIRYRQV